MKAFWEYPTPSILFSAAIPDGELRWNTKQVLGWERFNANILAFDAIEGQYKIAIKTAHGKCTLLHVEMAVGLAVRPASAWKRC